MTQTGQTARAYERTDSDATTFEPFIVGGQAIGEVHWLRAEGSDGRTLAAGLWRAEPMSFPYPFANDETIHVLEGQLEVKLEDGETLNLGPGDLVSFTKGTNSTWTVKTPFKKFFIVSG